MSSRLRVVVYGSSRHMAGILKRLKGEASLEVVFLNPRTFGARSRLREERPRAILFDLTDASSPMYITLLQTSPEILLIGVDPEQKDLLLLSGPSRRPFPAGDLIRVIQHGALEWE